MIYALLKTLHLLAIILWVGGMLFAHFFLRPAAALLEPPVRLKLMHDVLGRFFAAVLVASLTALVTGLWMMGRVAKQAVQSGGSFSMPLDWWVMAVLGVLMVAIFGHIRFVLYKRLSQAVAAATWPVAGAAMNSIRQWVTVNLALGLLIVVVVLLV
jgi:uncharacterized membrane protein